ncbi:MAG: ATP-binding protein [Spirochaetales bacterium]|nr:ATP-binding protein [Spirochaetales bacterium]
MQLKEFHVTKLFHKYDHTIPFEIRSESDKRPSLIIIDGQNGVGKTTVLKMIYGFSKLDFDIFRIMPFERAHLRFSDNSEITCEPIVRKKDKEFLKVCYQDMTVDLPIVKGNIEDWDTEKIDNFKNEYFNKTSTINLDFISTERIKTIDLVDSDFDTFEEYLLFKKTHSSKLDKVKETKISKNDSPLSRRVRHFISEAQIDYRRYFISSEPELFPKIISRLSNIDQQEFKAADLVNRLTIIEKSDKSATDLGLTTEQLDYGALFKILNEQNPTITPHALMVIGSYIEFLESKIAERVLLVERINTFIKTVNSFFINKNIVVHPKEGLQIFNDDGNQLTEFNLSSGEYHLLYLLVSALVTRRRGTVISIDEPEMSMHLSWQRNLLPAILKCAFLAQPQLIVATHSPEIAANYPENTLTFK